MTKPKYSVGQLVFFRGAEPIYGTPVPLHGTDASKPADTERGYVHQEPIVAIRQWDDGRIQYHFAHGLGIMNENEIHGCFTDAIVYGRSINAH